MPRVAITGLQDRFKPRKREVLRQVLIGRVRDRRVDLRRAVSGTGGRVRSAAITHAGVMRRSARIRVAEVLGIALPAHLRSVQLLEQRRHICRVHTAVGTDLPVRALGRGHLTVVGVRLQRPRGVDVSRKVFVDRTVVLRVRLRRLAAHGRQIVVEAEVPGAVVVLQEHALTGQRPPQVRVLVQARERRVIGLVLKDDQPDMLDLARLDSEAVPAAARRVASRSPPMRRSPR